MRYNPYKLFVGSFIPNWLLQCSAISSTAKLCYARLAQYAGEKGYCYPSQAQLAQEIGIGVRQVIRVLKELENKGFIEVEKPQNKDKLRHFRNKYYFITNQYLPCDIYVTTDSDIYDTIIKENHIKENQTNGLSTIVQRPHDTQAIEKQHFLSFDEYKDLYYTPDEASAVISLYLDIYKHYRCKPHPRLKPDTWNRVIRALKDDENDFSLEDHELMIRKHFTMHYSKPIDYNICHYVTEGILRNRNFETCY